MSIIAFITDPVPVRSILSYLDLPTRPPPLSPSLMPIPPTGFKNTELWTLEARPPRNRAELTLILNDR